jgi:hypothetical protein
MFLILCRSPLVRPLTSSMRPRATFSRFNRPDRKARDGLWPSKVRPVPMLLFHPTNAPPVKLGTNYEVTVPQAIENGDYIMRHEIIALHLADSKGGAEFYTSCYQLRVTGGTGSGAVTPTAKFPGAYSATDPGIFTPKVFDSGFKYQFPGPAIPKFAAGTGVASSNTTTPSNSSASTEPSATVSEAAPEATDDCTDDDNEEPTSTGSAATPTATDDGSDDDCTDEEPATTSSKAPKPTGKKHSDYRRAQAAGRGWGSRMEKRYVGASVPRS